MDKIVVLGGRDVVLGFKLVGVSEGYAVSPEDAEARLGELLERSDVGIVILEDEYAQKLSLKMKRRLELVSKPVVVEVGVKPGSSAGSLQALIKRAIGVTLEK